MSNSAPEKTLALILKAMEQAGQRGIIGAGWGGVQADRLPGSVFGLTEAPHAWLFPRMAGVVHHGGAGTTAAGLRAGRPTLIVPHMGDQPFWARRVRDLGVGVKSVPRHALTAERLAAAVHRPPAVRPRSQRRRRRPRNAGNDAADLASGRVLIHPGALLRDHVASASVRDDCDEFDRGSGIPG